MASVVFSLIAFAVGFGVGYWVCHRGVSGVVSDAKDAVNTVKNVGD